MRHHNFTAFDEFVVGTTTVSTSNELNSRLGHFDQLAIQVVVDNCDGNNVGVFTLGIQHAADGRNFTNWNAGTDVVMTLATNANNVGYCSVPGALQTPLLSYVKLQMTFSGGTTKGHVRVTVTQRDQGS